MDFIAINHRGIYVINHDGPIWIEKFDEMVIFINNLNKSDYTQRLIKTTLVSSGDVNVVVNRLGELTKLKRFDFLLAQLMPLHPHMHLHLKYSPTYVKLTQVVDGETSSPKHERSFNIADTNTCEVISRLPVINETVLDSLVKAGVIRSWEHCEYPWVPRLDAEYVEMRKEWEANSE